MKERDNIEENLSPSSNEIGLDTGRTETTKSRTDKRKRRTPQGVSPVDPQPTGKEFKISKHGADMMTRPPRKKQEEMLSRVSLPDEGSCVPRTIEERTQIFAQLIARSIGLNQFEKLEDCPDRIGFNLTNKAQRAVLFSVLQLLTRTNYQGDLQIPNSVGVKTAFQDEQKRNNPDRISQALTNGFETTIGKNHIGGALQNIPSTPVLRMTQRDLVIMSGYDPDINGDVYQIAEAVLDLATKQNFLMWTRIKRDNKGTPIRNPKTKKLEFELVSTFSPVLWVNFVSDPVSKRLQYYEISPSPVFLDEVSAQYGGGKNGYFLLIPEEANREIETTYRKMFKYRPRIAIKIQTFCFWLRVRVQELQGKVNNPFSRSELDPVIRIRYEDLCRELDMNESAIKKHRKTTIQNVSDGIRVSKEIGYITDGYLDEETDTYILTLNFDFYPPFRKKESEGIEAPEEQELLPPDSTDM